jgi:hypothetical protein
MRDGLYSARERSRSRSSRRKCDGGIDNDDVDPDDDPLSSSHTLLHNYDKMMLSFEFHVEAMGGQTSSLSTTATRNDDGGVGKVRGGGGEGGGGGGGSSCRATVTSFFRVHHRVGVTDANGISLSTSIASRSTRSEIVSHPRLWLRLLDQLRRTAEVALTIDDGLRVVTETSFHRDHPMLQTHCVSHARLQKNTALFPPYFAFVQCYVRS